MSAQHLSPATTIPLKTVFPIVAVIISVGLWLKAGEAEQHEATVLAAQRVEVLVESMNQMKLDIQELRDEVRHTTWSERDMRIWVNSLKMVNPTLTVPDGFFE